ncbi:MAG: P-loop NTPase fold protein [Bacteroidota bacterium]|jgi:hypothetical protein|nr:hypothetical protein [Cytophagales bacterium]MCE2957431.1 KAP family NTPase [Flammeovirgaceae bacterium]MCZ8069717.1 P-loop NTPase fold protein [Cytophagales bacterium]
MEIKSDAIAKKDILNRKPFATEIAKQIFEYFESSNESLIIGIHGSWGSGKSTLLSFIKDEISMRKPGCISFEFNPWMFSGKEELHKMFLKEFGIELGSKRQKIREVVKTFANLLTWTENIDGGWKSIIGLFKKLSETTVVQLKKEIDSLLIKEKVQSVIFLDDIDRLTPVEMLEIFQLIRLNANFSNTVFIISFDKEVVSTAIENQYSLDGEKYLEKIIQVDYSLPDILPERIESLFFETLNSMLAKYEIEFKTSELNYPWAYKGLQNFFKNVRDINRFFNAIKFRLPAIHGNIDIHDFLIIEAIRIFDHESYVLIKTFYKDSVKFGSDSHAKEELSRINNGRSVSLYALLFENNYRKKRTSQYEISNAQFFDRYFSLSISSKDVREEDFQHYLNLEKDGTDYLGILIETGRIEFLLRRLSVVELYSEDYRKERYLREVIAVWPPYVNKFPDHYRYVWDVLKAILVSYEDLNKGAHFVIDTITLSEPQFNPARFLFKHFVLQNLEENNDTELQKCREVVENRRADLLRAIEHEIRNHMSQFLWSEIYPNFHTKYFFVAFAKYMPTEYKEQLAVSFKDNPKITFKLLRIFVLTDTSTGTPFGIDRKYEPDLLANGLRELFIKKVKSVNIATLQKNDARITEYYLAYLNESDLSEKVNKK